MTSEKLALVFVPAVRTQVQEQVNINNSSCCIYLGTSTLKNKLNPNWKVHMAEN